ncbi:hypothetical protein AAMO2058_000330900 [Amorphochlora amoebiformis]
MGFPRPLNPVIPTVGISIDLTQCLSISKRHHPPSFPMPLAKDISNYLGYSAVLLALWYGFSVTSNMYQFLNPETCKYDGDPELCVLPSFKDDQGFAIEIHLTHELPIRSLGKPVFAIGHDTPEGFRASTDTFSTEIQVPVKKYGLHKNRTLYAIAVAKFIEWDPSSRLRLWAVAPLTHYGLPEAEKVGLFDTADEGSQVAKKKKTKLAEDQSVLYWHGNLSLHLVADQTIYPKHGLPGDIAPYYQISEGKYLPALYIEQLSVLHKKSRNLHDLDTKKNKTLSLNITISPISLGRWRIYQQLEGSLTNIKVQWGFGEPEADQLKQLFCYTNHILLATTLAVSLLHSLFSFLAMKNDIMYWRKRDTMLGLSASQIIFECVASYIVILYLVDSDQGNKVVNFLCACECLIATWKLVKMIRMRRKDKEKADNTNKAESMESLTSKYDAVAIKYLGGILIPFVVGYCIYSLLYEPHKSLYSWAITSLASVVYAIGFILMTPQLFINFKLKSVAHLPWRTLTYKAFNTFVDDLVSLVIDMPFLHRLACFRDDIVFLIFLYQWWLYGADKNRSYELEEEGDDPPLQFQNHEDDADDEGESTTDDALRRRRRRGGKTDKKKNNGMKKKKAHAQGGSRRERNSKKHR